VKCQYLDLVAMTVYCACDNNNNNKNINNNNNSNNKTTIYKVQHHG